MHRVAAAAALALALATIARPTAEPGQSPAAPLALTRWLDAEDAWNAGHYPDALRALLALTKSPAAAEFHDRIALLTGELFTTTEVTANGRNPRVSRTGRYVAYEVPTAGLVTTRVIDTEAAMRVLAEMPTTVAVFDPTGRQIAWLRADQPGAPGSSEILVRDLESGSERVAVPSGLMKTGVTWSGRDLAFIGADANDPTRSNVYLAAPGQPAWAITETAGHKTNLLASFDGRVLVYARSAASPFGNQSGPPAPTADIVVIDRTTRTTRVITGATTGSMTMSADGGMLAWIAPAADGAATLYRSPTLTDTPLAIERATGAQRVLAPALSPDGRFVAYQFQNPVGSSTDWEIYVADDGGTRRRLTEDIQHDVLPRFLSGTTVLGLIGEPRHRRAHLYDLSTGARTRVFANNTIRTISPEYAWAANADGTRLVIQADRDGDTVSTERGIYLVDLTRRVTAGELSARLTAQLDHETALRNRMAAAYRPIADHARQAAGRVSAARVYNCHRALAEVGSKHISRPGNLKAVEYLRQAYASSGFEPELQWIETKAPGAGGAAAIRTANVVATLRGAVNPGLVYVASSHFDSVSVSPGADDNTSGTCALLETARVLAAAPIAATVVFASFTGEESGLLGSREFVRLAAQRSWRIAGALNNDMIGWSGDGARMDNTIRYSNAGIRDLQHGAAFLFSELVLFDARYFLGTDAAAFNQAWGDIVGGLGSYPILANPNYHQRTDLLETINFRQVAETAKVTAATLIALASSPERVTKLEARRTGAAVEVTWAPARESDVRSYVVTYGPAGEPDAGRLTVRTARATVPNLPRAGEVRVKAVNARGLESWDWARLKVD